MNINHPQQQPNHLVERILIMHDSFQKILNRLEQCFQYADGATEPMCVAVLGESRTGKSRVIEEFCNRHKDVRTPEGIFRPVVRLRTPAKPTVKGMAELMLTAMGERYDLGGTEQKKTAQIKRLLRSCGTRAVVIEEFNHLVDTASGKVAFHATDWLKEIADARNIMLCVSGLESCRKAISLNEQLAGRFSKPMILPRFDWRSDADRREFKSIIGAFEAALKHEYHMPAFTSDSMAFRIFCATGGIIGYVSKLLREVVLAAVRDNRSIVTLEDLAEADKVASWDASLFERGFNPFDRDFPISEKDQENDALLHQVAQIGTRKVENSLGASSTSWSGTKKAHNSGRSGIDLRGVLSAKGA